MSPEPDHCEPPLGTAQVLSPLKNLVESAVPLLPSRAIGTVPLPRFEALRAVMFAPGPEIDCVNVPVVKVADPGVVAPIAPGSAKVFPPSVVALIVPEPVTAKEPATNNAALFVPPVISLKAVEAPPPP